MRSPDRAKRALERADTAEDEISRSLWLSKAADHGISAKAVLVGGAAVNLHTGSYRPTDVDMCAYLDEADRASLRSLGFGHIQGDHFDYTFSDGETWLIEFPDTHVDGTVVPVRLAQDEILEVISLESLMVDRLLQATDGSGVTFDEAVRLAFATYNTANWEEIEKDVSRREASGEVSGLGETLEGVLRRVGDLLNS